MKYPEWQIVTFDLENCLKKFQTLIFTKPKTVLRMPDIDKNKLKIVFLRKRKTITNAEFEKRNVEIFYHFSAWLEDKTINNIHCFLPIEKQREVDTRIFVKYLNALGYKVILSRCSLDNNDMTHFFFEEKGQLLMNQWGIIEPQGGKICPVDEIDAVLIPLVVFDRQGHRIGYGKGYYDRFLSQCRVDCHKVGLSLTPPLDSIPYIEPHDIRLDSCITPSGTYDFI